MVGREVGGLIAGGGCMPGSSRGGEASLPMKKFCAGRAERESKSETRQALRQRRNIHARVTRWSQLPRLLCSRAQGLLAPGRSAGNHRIWQCFGTEQLGRSQKVKNQDQDAQILVSGVGTKTKRHDFWFHARALRGFDRCSPTPSPLPPFTLSHLAF